MIAKAVVIIIIFLVFVFIFSGNVPIATSILDIVSLLIFAALILSGITAIMEAISKEDDIEPGELICRVILGIIALLLLIKFIVEWFLISLRSLAIRKADEISKISSAFFYLFTFNLYNLINTKWHYEFSSFI